MVKVSSETKQTHQGGLLTSNGTISLFLRDLMEEMKYQRVPSGGAGNKMLMLLEGKGDIYIQDRGYVFCCLSSVNCSISNQHPDTVCTNLFLTNLFLVVYHFTI